MTEKPTPVTVAGAALVAIGSAIAIAPVAAGTGYLARAAGKNRGHQNETYAEDELHGETDLIAYQSPQERRKERRDGAA